MLKTAIRQLYREKRKALSVVERNKLDDLLLIRFQSTEIPFISSLLTFWPIEKNHEPNVHLVTDYLAFTNPGLVIAYPVTDPARNEMQAVVPGEKGFIINRFGIEEPVGGEVVAPGSLDMVLVPLMAVDTEGFRVGYGKGFYDRFLGACSNDCIKIGFSYFEPVDQVADKDDFDVPLDLCITPQTVYVF